MMAAQIAERLTGQEEEIRHLSAEIGRLLELGLSGTVQCDPSPALQELRAENDKLKYRIAHLQRSLERELGGPEPDSQGPQDTEQPRGAAPGGDNQKSTVEKTTAQQYKRKKEKKQGIEVNGQKPEGTLQNGIGVGTAEHAHPVGAHVSNCHGRLPDFLQLLYRREYWDASCRPWKIIFPLDEVLKEPAGVMILLRLEEHREPATQDQLANVSDCKLPRWLELKEDVHYKSPGTTWKVLFRDPSPDNYLLLLKKGMPLSDCSTEDLTGPHPKSLRMLK